MTQTRWPLIGRDTQVQAIVAVVRRRPAGGVVVAGAAGLGKTRLATEALGQAATRGCATTWAVGTQAAASIPFGSLVHLLPETGPAAGGGESRLDLLRRAGEAVARRAGGRPMVIGVDDAHLLDDASAALVHHLVTSGRASVIATVRTGEPAPDAVTALWKDGLAERLELEPLPEADAARLVETVVGGQVDGAVLRRLMRLSHGNPLFLRELVVGALEAGSLVEVAGVWRAVGTLTTSTRLAEVVRARLGRLPTNVRAVAEIVAIAEPIGAALLEAVVAPEDLDATDRAGLLELLPDPRRTLVRLAHPLYGEVLRTTTTPLRSRTVRRRLAAALEMLGAGRRDDLLRLAVWQVEGGGAADPDLLTRAARSAAAMFDHGLSERLASAAGRAGGGPPARLALAQAQAAQGRAAEAEALLVQLEQVVAADPDGPEAARVALARAGNLLRGLGRSAEAMEVVQRAEQRCTVQRWCDELTALRATIAIFQGRPVDALEADRRVLERADAPPVVVVRALATAVAASGYRGQVEDAVDAAQRGLALLGGTNPETRLSLAADHLLTMLSVALRLAGRLDEAETLPRRRYAAALEARADDLRASAALALGEVALARGRVVTAMRWAREAAALLRDHTTVFGMQGIPWAFGCLAQVAAVAGDLSAADAALAAAEEAAPGDYYVPNRARGRVWVLACSGRVALARDLALQAADAAAERSALAFELVALHDAVRLGGADRVVDRLQRGTQTDQGRIAPLYAAHAAALVHDSGTQLEQVSAGFEQLGAVLLAAESAAAAAASHRRAGRRGTAAAALARARLLAERCEGARTPALDLAEQSSAGLTAREREIVVLAGRGWPSQRIADELTVSVRTIDNHLHRAYAKLGVSGRDELSVVLDLVDTSNESRHSAR